MLPSAASVVQFDRIASATDNRVIVADWFARHVPPGDSVLQSGSIYGYTQIDNRVWTVWTWDRYRKAFMVRDRRAQGQPTGSCSQESPLPSMTKDVITAFLKEDYHVAGQFTAYSAPTTAASTTGRTRSSFRSRILGCHAPRAKLHAVQTCDCQPKHEGLGLTDFETLKGRSTIADGSTALGAASLGILRLLAVVPPEAAGVGAWRPVCTMTTPIPCCTSGSSRGPVGSVHRPAAFVRREHLLSRAPHAGVFEHLIVQSLMGAPLTVDGLLCQ